eukprot:TRINITY_DN1689_c0_g1_i1.p1 TRINITY_DN1689_c0_g1~~TRINITY_DN1689_c0_g1_i1.p1  ORF type:complete len:830 (-),score=288.69 TRINITY_DN1689_c0_g1_i1:525-3014(-)
MKRATGLLCIVFALCLVCILGPSQKVNANADPAPASSDPPKVEENIAGKVGGSGTDANVVEKEGKSRKPGQKFEFQAEVSRLMDIIINSLYSNKDIFLRELISNASDALDKIRFLSLTDKSQLGEGDDAKLEIQIKLDKDKKILSIRDRGVGMTKEDLIKNLGTIAKSGTSAFVEQAQKGGDLNLIGQFGVGFYSVYLVADMVEVVSKHNDDKQYIWESRADGNFEVTEDENGEPLGRGTEIRIHLKDEASEYAQEDKLKELVKKYSEFINFPIYLWETKEVEKEVPLEEGEEEEKEEEKEDAEEAKDDEEESKEGEEEEEEEETPKTKKIKEKISDWELLNDVKAIWLRQPSDVKDEEYVKFYDSVSKDFSGEKPLSWTHFKAEGDVEFRAVLFIPGKAPYDFYDNYYTSKATLKLYVRRVFISDEFDELLPKYLAFLKGLVDSDSMPLNVSREMLQQHSSLKTIKKKLIRKALDMIKKIVEEDLDEVKKDDKESEGDDKPALSEENRGKYAKFWKEFGKAIKLGIVEDSTNRVRLAKLLRFYSSKSEDKFTSLDDYISRMKPGQKQIYYLTGTNQEQLKKSPFLEKLLKKGYEVIFFTDPIDEYLMQNLTEYDEKKFQNASKEDLKIGEKDEDEKKKQKEIKESFKPLTKWWKELLGSDVESVKVSNRLSETPCIVVTSKYGWSANMERIMKAQALSDDTKQAYMKGKKTLEINPRHPIIKDLREKVANDEESELAKSTAQLVYEIALLESGFNFDDPASFAKRAYTAVKTSLGVDQDAVVDEEVEEPETEEVEEVKEEVKEVPKEAEEEDASGLKVEVTPEVKDEL